MQNDKLLRKIRYGGALKSFVLSFLVAFLFFVPFIIFDKGYFIYYGDYNVQEIPFYMVAHQAVRQGNIFWHAGTDLGANFVGSYSFYLLGSPFFWVTLFFPGKCVPYLMAPLLVLKISLASLFSFLYFQRYVKNKDLAVLGGLLYAFSGFSLYNIFFNHFHEAILVFPLVLYALDELIYNQKVGFFAFTVFFSCLMNYYFFVGQSVFLVIYLLIRIFAKSYYLKANQLFAITLEFILGVFASSALLFPALLSAVQNPRTNDFPFGFSAILYPFTERYIHILESFLFLPDIPAIPNFTPNSQAQWSSVSAWLPFFGAVGVVAYIKTKKKSWVKTSIITLVIMAFVPILNSSFQAFNQTFYTRWFYMLTLMLALATLLALENKTINWQPAIKPVAIITVSISVFTAFMPEKITLDNEKITTKLGLMNYPDRFWVYVAISLFCLFGVSYLVRFCKNSPNFINLLIIFTCATIVVSSFFVVYLGKQESPDSRKFFIPYSLRGKKNIHLPDSQVSRSDVFEGMENQAMFWDIPTIQAFHTIVPGSIMEFYPAVGVDRCVKSEPDIFFFGLRGLLSCRWLFDYKDKDTHFYNTPMPGWVYYDRQNNFDIWENRYFIPYGFTYDSYITKEEFDSINIENRHLILLKAMVLDKQQETKYSNIMQHIRNINRLDYSQNAYFDDCKARKNDSSSFFSYNKRGFSAKIENKDKKEKLVFFSIPWEKGWKAYVNGSPTEIERVNIGFMAVTVPKEKTSTIRFSYLPPGLVVGTFTSAASAVLYVIYLFVNKLKHSKKQRS